MMSKKKHMQKNGFTLIETLISLAILSIIVVGIMAMMMTYINSNLYLKHHSDAVQLAVDGIEDAMRVPYTSLQGLSTTEAWNSIANFPDFCRQTTVTNFNANGLCTISVLVGWKPYANAVFNASTQIWPVRYTFTRSSR